MGAAAGASAAGALTASDAVRLIFNENGVTRVQSNGREGKITRVGIICECRPCKSKGASERIFASPEAFYGHTLCSKGGGKGGDKGDGKGGDKGGDNGGDNGGESARAPELFGEGGGRGEVVVGRQCLERTFVTTSQGLCSLGEILAEVSSSRENEGGLNRSWAAGGGDGF